MDMEKLLETPQLEHIFTQYQKDEILSRQVSHERVGKCLDFVEAKGNAACQKLTDVVEQLGLLKLNPVAHQRSNDLSPSPYHSHSLSRKYARASLKIVLLLVTLHMPYRCSPAR